MCKILIIDDDKDLLDIIQSLLTKRGFDVETDDNWQNDFEKIKRLRPQVILLDVFLCGIDGLHIANS